MPPLRRLPVCPMGQEVCPVLAGFLRLGENCRRLKELSQTDPLTGLYNRRHLLISLEQEMERTRRSGLATSLIMMDLDHFKRVNDTYGHQFGDAVLCRVADLLKGSVRKFDIPCRYGGEEFALVLPASGLPQAVRLAVRLKIALDQTGVEPQGQGWRLTASFGVDSYTGSEDLTAEAFLQQADGWLFLAKARGRNTVCHPASTPGALEAGLTGKERRAFFLPDNLSGKTGESYG